MRQDRPSRSAIGAMFLRAAATHSPHTSIFMDPYAERLLPWPLGHLGRQPLISRGTTFGMRHSTIMRALTIVLLRARYTEDRLVERMAQGVSQYVILGAGWDSFVLRRPDLVAHLRVFEVDHPATQRSKQERLAELGFHLPDNVHFVPVDFEQQPLGAALSSAGLDPARATLVCWQGVSYYLTPAALENTFSQLAAGCDAELDVIFDYLDARYFQHRQSQRRASWLNLGLRLGGERFLSGFDPAQLGTDLAPLGYHVVEQLLGNQLATFWPAAEMGSLRPRSLVHFAHVRKPANPAITPSQPL